MSSIWWIRRDLRLTDNAALMAALEGGEVLPVFILDPKFRRHSTRRRNFLYEGLKALDQDLIARGSRLIVRKGHPIEVLRTLQREIGARAIFAEEDFTPYARKRDFQVAELLPLVLIPGQTVHHPQAILKPDGKPYTVFTPYSKKWKAHMGKIELLPAPAEIFTPASIASLPIPAYKSNPHFPAGEREALVRLDEFTHRRIHAYGEQRDRMDLEGTSALSPYIRFGMLGLRQAVHAARQALDHKQGAGSEAWVNEIIWREFYIQILYHFPRVLRTSFNPAYAHIPWRNVQAEFIAWKEGLTGIPIVDAAMRQLKETGWMHNRARMITASFLVKDLLIDWRWGESWFMENLLDGDPAANNGGWQWTAGTGTDSAPYFRIFNPVLQSTRFDPKGDYIRKWVPELEKLSDKEIHAPWTKGKQVPGYPERPLVERSIVKERTLNAYQASKLHIRSRAEEKLS